MLFWLAIAALSFWWSADEHGGNRWFLWGLGTIALAFAAWRAQDAFRGRRPD
ncbi:MAG TPA: hypothetical protein VNS81_06210 [Nocardioides sp.]|nr:hypothetical protein [Nocardioides sp.]